MSVKSSTKTPSFPKPGEAGYIEPKSFGGVIPSLAQVAELGPPKSEIGVGCLQPWNGKLYVVNYNSHKAHSGAGVGMRVIDENLQMIHHPEAVDGTYANRFVHHNTNRMIIGPHVVDPEHNVTTIKELVPCRLCGVAKHLTNDELVYVLAMEGEVFELNPVTFECKQIMDLQEELGTEGEGRVHFKDCYSCFGRFIVCSNEYNEDDWKRERDQGRLAEWDGKKWTILERKPFVCTAGREGFGGTTFASGWDQASAILKVFTDADKTWRTYRLPKASHCFDHKWQTEWPRIREVEHERLLMDHHGMFYELSPWAYGNRIWGVRPISTHLWVHGDFCSYRGMLVLGADNASNPGSAEPQSGLWFGKTDDLWKLGKATGWGGPWWDQPIKAGEASDPYLMTGFDKKCIHIKHDADKPVTFNVEVDFMGCGEFVSYAKMAAPAKGYVQHTFPEGFSAHWVRVTSDSDCTATAQLFYT
tara:strand:- start:1331 stop:2749 length:1419 start_codon:yes stop_codon:yes gene_type:complete